MYTLHLLQCESYWLALSTKVMINVFANVMIKKENIEQAPDCYRDFVPLVIAESGCLEYVPCKGINTDLTNQVQDDSRIFVAECWKSLKDFRKHLEMPHSVAFRARIKPLLTEKITVTIVQPVSLS